MDDNVARKAILSTSLHDSYKEFHWIPYCLWGKRALINILFVTFGLSTLNFYIIPYAVKYRQTSLSGIDNQQADRLCIKEWEADSMLLLNLPKSLSSKVP